MVLRFLTLGVAALLGVVGITGTAHAKGDEIGGSGSEYFLNDALAGPANHHFLYGRSSDRAYVGDWNGDGVDSLAVRRQSQYFLRNALAGGDADAAVVYGRASDVVLVGDWDGDGDDTLAVRRGNVYHIKNSLSGGPADRLVPYGRADDVVLVGDWDGDGVDTLAVRRGNVYHVKNSLSGGPADQLVPYGRVSDEVVVGDWDGDGDDSLAVRRGSLYLFKDALGGGAADREAVYGRAGDAVFAGDWNADAVDTLGVRRGSCQPVGTTADQTSGTNPFADLSTVTGASMRVSEHGCFDRVVLEFRGPGEIPGWTAQYVDLIRNEETGESVQPSFEGGAFIHIVFGAWDTGEPADRPPFSGPRRVLPEDFRALREARALGGFEGVSDFGIGLDRVRPYHVEWLENPVRMVVDVYTG
ncbi:AMIN-like domain-containing (lipo)protein [Georgenia subflava]|uniref:AMIN-like domain-containing (lipo)protein n=1 Tax=Georgenia subflava TaxID=1622177 RepID=UPI00186B1A6D|nr:hypothetical protein [Georgenia subflava]